MTDFFRDISLLLNMTKGVRFCDFAESTTLDGLESVKVRGILLFAKAKEAKTLKGDFLLDSAICV